MRKINLLIRYTPDGRMVPIHFTCQDESFLITDVGRSWVDEAGTHILVLTGQGTAGELIHSSKDSNWYIRDKPDHFKI